MIRKLQNNNKTKKKKKKLFWFNNNNKNQKNRNPMNNRICYKKLHKLLMRNKEMNGLNNPLRLIKVKNSFYDCISI